MRFYTNVEYVMNLQLRRQGASAAKKLYIAVPAW